MLKRILVIDDDEDILQLLDTVLNMNGYEIICLDKTEDIISDVSAYNPNLIITDYLLDGLNGGKICQIIKSNESTCHIPVILITAYAELASLHGNFGFDGFIDKPFEIDELINTVKELI